MKRKLSSLLAVLFAVSILVSCGAKTVQSNVASSAPGEIAKNESMYDYEMGYASGGTTANAAPPMGTPMPEAAPEEDWAYDDIAGTDVIDLPLIPQGGDGLSEKIIYSIYAEIETVEFDAAVDGVYELLDKYGAFIENSYISGKNYSQTYYGHQSYRSARFVLRVPKERLTEAAEGLDALGNVTSLQSDAQNITAQFVDTQSRLTAYRTEETRLLELLGKADTVADMIVIESRLSEVRYQIESLTSTLNNWQNQIDYSVLTINIGEVEKLSEILPVQRPYFVRIADGIKSTLGGIGDFFKDLFMWLAVNSPVLAILGALAAVVLVIVRKRLRKKSGKKSSEHTEE